VTEKKKVRNLHTGKRDRFKNQSGYEGKKGRISACEIRKKSSKNSEAGDGEERKGYDRPDPEYQGLAQAEGGAMRTQ